MLMCPLQCYKFQARLLLSRYACHARIQPWCSALLFVGPGLPIAILCVCCGLRSQSQYLFPYFSAFRSFRIIVTLCCWPYVIDLMPHTIIWYIYSATLDLYVFVCICGHWASDIYPGDIYIYRVLRVTDAYCSSRRASSCIAMTPGWYPAGSCAELYWCMLLVMVYISSCCFFFYFAVSNFHFKIFF